MNAVEKVTNDLMNYFAALGAAAGHNFSIRDFHSQVMMNTFAAEERAGLDLALAQLVETGVLRQASPTEYVLTPQGLLRVRAIRGSTGRLVLSRSDVDIVCPRAS
jgi:hypothetical protein